MLRGLYTATASLATEMSAIELLSNNIANTNTVGFKQDLETLQRQGANPLSYGMNGLVRGTGILDVRTTVDLNQGSLRDTSGPLDVALQGPGMFGQQSAAGVVYSRNGRFNVSANGQLVAENGNLVLDQNGKPMTVPDLQGQVVVVKSDGTLQVGATTVGRIGVFNATNWTKAGNALYAPVGGTATPTTATPMQQGMLEQGNVDLVGTMSALMTAERSYEAASQLQRTMDQMLQQGANDIGRL